MRVYAAACAVTLLLSGCASMVQQSRNQAMDKDVTSANYTAAAKLAEDRIGLKPNPDGSLPEVRQERGNVLNHLDAAEAWNLAGNVDRSIAHYDAAEISLKDVETQDDVSAGGKQVGAVLTNDTVLDYVPSPGEAVLINFEKAMEFWSKDDIANTRVELNRADDRTRRAVERYRAELAKANAEAAGKSYVSSDKVTKGVAAQFPEMAQWQTYSEFIVPSATYVKALFLSRMGDRSDQDQAFNLFKRVSGVVGPHSVIDQEVVEAQSGRVCPQDDCIWVLVEHGLGPQLVEKRFDLPVPMPTGVVVATIALPKLVSRTNSDVVPFPIIYGDNAVSPELFASMDRVVQTEFQRRWPAVVARAVVSSVVKATAQVAVNQSTNNMPYGSLFKLVANVASVATTSADIRMWRSMPSRWSLARVHRDGSKPLIVQTTSGPTTVDLPASGSALVFIKAPDGGLSPKLTVLKI